MDRILNPRIEKQTIYEIYRACRLCGAGAGYKMPIIQNVVDLEGSEVELKQKIRECVQVEVNQDDKMPPLICELCVDKVNDFYEFLELCRQTNKRTRMRLGLPMQSVTKGSSSTDSGDCILGMTEPVYVNDDSDGEPLAKQKMKGSRNTKKKQPEVRIKLESLSQHRDTRATGNRSSRIKRDSPPRSRPTRHSAHSDNVALSRLQGHGLKNSPKSILKKEKDVKIKSENDSSLSSRLKRHRDKESSKPVIPVKRVKIEIRNTVSTNPKQSRPSSPNSRVSGRARRPSPARRHSPVRRPTQARTAPAAPTHSCTICDQLFKSAQGIASHLRTHAVTYTHHKMACNACGLWFSSTEEAATHHRRHRNKARPYTCPRCNTHFKQQATFDEHYNKNKCVPSTEVPDIKCEVCWRFYPTNNLYEEHKCGGEEVRRGGKCTKCSRSYSLFKNLKKHESTCTAKKKDVNISPRLMKQLKPLQVRVARCDPLLLNVKQEHVDVSDVDHEYGLDRNCVYPYITYGSFRIKSEFSINQRDGMVAIGEGIKDEFCSESFVHWDSEDESDSDTEISNVQHKPIESLSALTLKTIFSHKFLGKVPRKRRRVKTEKFDTNVDLYGDISKNIDSIIDNLGDDDEMECQDDVGKSKGDLNIDFDNLLGDDKDMDGGKETSVEETSKNDENAVSFDDLLKNDDQVSKTKDDQDDETVKGEQKERGVEDISKNDASAVSQNCAKNLLKNDDQVSKTKEQDDEIVKVDEKETEVNDASKTDVSTVNFDDLLKNDHAQVSDTKNQNYDEVVEMSETNTNKVTDEAMETDDTPNNDKNAELSNNDVEMSETNTNKVTDEAMKTDDTPNNDKNVELLNNDVEKSDSSTDVKDGEKNSEVVVNNDINNEQSNVYSVNDKVVTEDISKDSKEMELNETSSNDKVESEKAKETDEDVNKMDISQNNTSIENTDNKVPLNDAPKETKNSFQSNDNGADIIHEQSTKYLNNAIVNMEDPKSDELNNLDDISDTEMDDKKLMEALDAQIGESNDKTHNNDQSPTNNEVNNVCNESQNDERENERNDEIGNEIKNQENNEAELNDAEQSNSAEKTKDNAISEKDLDRKDTSVKTDVLESKTNDGAVVNDRINDRIIKSNDKIAEKYDTAYNDQKDAKFNDKITLDDLISKRQNSDMKSLDLDNISDDEFNFDV